VPITAAEQLAEPVARIEVGEQLTVTPVTVIGTLTLITVEPDLLASWVDVAVMVAGPAPLGVYTPADVIVPLVEDHVTAEL
jgi:hypothetical protein